MGGLTGGQQIILAVLAVLGMLISTIGGIIIAKLNEGNKRMKEIHVIVNGRFTSALAALGRMKRKQHMALSHDEVAAIKAVPIEISRPHTRSSDIKRKTPRK